jgi:AraC-like DNA-binding protein
MPIDSLTVPNILDYSAELKLQGFKVYPIDTEKNIVRAYNRKDFYKVCLVHARCIVQYQDKGYEVEGSSLFFGNPRVPYSCENLTHATGYTLLFSERFLDGHARSESLRESPLFTLGGNPIFSPDPEQTAYLSQLFERMLAEQNSPYRYRDDLIRNYLYLVIHEALKMRPGEQIQTARTASARIAIAFLDMLERQFPIESASQPLELKTAQGFAERLAVHVNHLNRAVKQVTGKTTTLHIAERIITEAKALLKYTDWPVSQVAYALGFDYPTYFNQFFKKMTGMAPSAFRK